MQSLTESKVHPTLSENFVVFCSYLKRNPRSLVFLDNVEEEELLTDCLPSVVTPCHVLITTRSDMKSLHHQANVKVMNLETLQGEHAVAALLGWSGKAPSAFHELKTEERESIKRLALDSPVEGLPLALAHAGLFIQRERMTFHSYWTLLEAKAKGLDPAALDMAKVLSYFHISHLRETLQQMGVFSPAQLSKVDVFQLDLNPFNQRLVFRARDALKAKRHLYLTWELDIDHVSEHSSKGYLILRYCSLFSSQDIPQKILYEVAFSEEKTELRDVSFAMGTRALRDRSFLQQTEQNDGLTVFSMHHLVQESVLNRLVGDLNEYQTMLETVGRCLVSHLPSLDDLLTSTNLTNQVVISLLPHVYSIAKKLLETGIGRKESRDVIDYACDLSVKYMHLEMAKDLHYKRIQNLTNDAYRYNVPFEEEKLDCTHSYLLKLRARLFTLCLLGYCGMAQTCLFLNLYQDVAENVALALGGRSPDELTDEEASSYSPGSVALYTCVAAN